MTLATAEHQISDTETFPLAGIAEASSTDNHESTTDEQHAKKIPDWGVIGWLTAMHLGALAAPFTFTWWGLGLAVVLHWLTGGIGICLGYHRLLTHGSFVTYRPVRWFVALAGGLAGEGSALDWVANHRKHHALSDRPGDPHSPREGAWWSHVFWLLKSLPEKEMRAHHNKWIPDLQKDRVIRFIGKMFLPINIVFGLALTAIGYSFGGTQLAASFLVWGVFVRLVFVLHSTWFVNSASHIWGYRNYETTDDSRNNWWVAVISYGEGWHNNHHAYPRMAPHGHKWWEIDMTYTAIRLMKMVGIAWDVVDYKHKNEVATRNAA